MSQAGKEVRLASRPSGEPDPSNFELAEVEVADPGDGEILVRNTFMSVDPYMRGRMNAAKSYAAPYQIGQALWGGAVGEVVTSNAEGFAEDWQIFESESSRRSSQLQDLNLSTTRDSCAFASSIAFAIGTVSWSEKISVLVRGSTRLRR